MAAENVAITQVTVSALAVGAINWLKASPMFPWITKEKVVLLRAFSVVAAVATSVGIAWVWNPAAHSLTITGLSLTAIGTLLWASMKSFAMNELVYQTTKAKSDPAVVAAVAPAAAAKEEPKPAAPAAFVPLAKS